MQEQACATRASGTVPLEKKNPSQDKCVKWVVWQLLLVVIAVVANKLEVSI